VTPISTRSALLWLLAAALAPAPALAAPVVAAPRLDPRFGFLTTLGVRSLGPRSAPGDRPRPRLDGPARATFSPDGDGRDDRLVVGVAGPPRAAVHVVVAVYQRGWYVVWQSPAVRLNARGAGTVRWDGRTDLGQHSDDGSYDVFVCSVVHVPSACGRARGVAHARTLSLAVASGGSFPPGATVPVTIATDKTGPLTLGIYANEAPDRTDAVVEVEVRRGRTAIVVPPTLAPGVWRLGVSDAEGNDRYVPLVVRSALPLDAPPPGTALVVEPYLTWRAYNYADADRDGIPDTWYADFARNRAVTLTGPYESPSLDLFTLCGLPRCVYGDLDWVHARSFDAWLRRDPSRRAQVVTDLELADFPLDRLLRYAAVVLPGHTEYYPTPLYELLRAYRDRGGRIAYLSANGFYASIRVDRPRDRVRLGVRPLRAAAQSDFGLLGAGFRYCCVYHRVPYVLGPNARIAVPWLFEGTGLGEGDAFGSVTDEVDGVDPRLTPRGTRTIAVGRVGGPGPSGAIGTMTDMQRAGGGEVFAAGSMGFLRGLPGGAPRSWHERVMALVVSNLWTHLTALPPPPLPAGRGVDTSAGTG
jgi:hypothetical protein